MKTNNITIILIIFSLIGFIFLRKNFGTFEINKLTFLIGVALTGWFSIVNFEKGVKYDAPFFICNGIKGSFSDPPIIIGDFAILRLGGFLHPWHSAGDEGTVIIPKKSYRKHHFNISSNVKVLSFKDATSFPSYVLPVEVRHFIKNNNFPTPIYFGIYPDNVDVEYLDLEKIYKSQNVVLNHQQDVIDQEHALVDKVSSLASKMGESFNKTTALSKIASLFKKE